MQRGDDSLPNPELLPNVEAEDEDFRRLGLRSLKADYEYKELSDVKVEGLEEMFILNDMFAVTRIDPDVGDDLGGKDGLRITRTLWEPPYYHGIVDYLDPFVDQEMPTEYRETDHNITPTAKRRRVGCRKGDPHTLVYSSQW